MIIMSSRKLLKITCLGIIDANNAEITAAINKNILKSLVRVKSSNIWAYMIDIKDNKQTTGKVYVQFKGSRGQPDDIYVYYDVPIVIYRKWVGSPSKGRFFWRYIRNKYTYAKLTGNKKTKLKNGI